MRTTEQNLNYTGLESMSAREILCGINDEDHKLADTLIGISASGTAPYVIGSVRKAREIGMLTGCICCNEESALARECEVPIIAVVGPEFVTGSTRMKAGSATKLILNMISTSLMILTGHVQGNKMVDMQLTNKKLVDRVRAAVESLMKSV